MSEGRRILIINRGEIASRIGRACRELGHTSVGVWTDHERQPKHLEFCDEWVHLKGSTHIETYLNIDRILQMIEEHSCDAVHPGYGFLSENAQFAEILKKKGIIFIGPHSESIRIMGDKALSKQLAAKQGIPVIPGSIKPVETYRDAIRIAHQIMYPVLLKAIAGGGGKGMRACYSDEDIVKNFEVVQREAMAAFNNGELLVEKLMVDPRHIEVQIIGDKKGGRYHLFERECSIQRRHQKIIEEAPSPFVGGDVELRRSLCKAALRLAEAVRYDSVGTIEFIMDKDRNFYFLEMNTRIQVEHPVTEEITGIDLICCMIQAAFEEDMDIKDQSSIVKQGHAIECRIYAEDPITMIPATGFVTGFETSFPQGTRFDHCLYAGLEVTPDFDPMVGKLISRGIDRGVAIRSMTSALKGLLLEGLKTNIPLLRKIISSDAFVQNQCTTNYIESTRPQDEIDLRLNHLHIYGILASIESQKIGL